MALFTDGPISSIEDLRGHDTQILDVANVEQIDVTKKIVLAQEEVSLELGALLEKMAPGGQAGIARVVVTPPLRLWHTYRALEMVYRDAYHSQLNDRYAGRRDEYHETAKWARDKAIQNGVGMVADPIPQASTPGVLAVSGGLADGTYYVGMSWANPSGEEGACSIPAVITTAGSSFEVRHGNAPSNAAGWHVYVGNGPQTMLRQNAAVLTLGAAWVENSVVVGVAAGSGQKPGYLQPIARLLERG
jgi:hypothetical protein